MENSKDTINVALRPATKKRVDSYKVHPRESYDEAINRALDKAGVKQQ